MLSLQWPSRRALGGPAIGPLRASSASRPDHTWRSASPTRAGLQSAPSQRRRCWPPFTAGTAARSRMSRSNGTRYAEPTALLAQLVEHFHGKEGVVGSSPTEGLGRSRCKHRGLRPHTTGFITGTLCGSPCLNRPSGETARERCAPPIAGPAPGGHPWSKGVAPEATEPSEEWL
jgi:hypothetical protein